MVTIRASLRRLVIQRAENRCEYCRISQIGQVATFHIDHIVPVVAGGETITENLALACVSYSLRKGARQNLQDSETGAECIMIINQLSISLKSKMGLQISISDSILQAIRLPEQRIEQELLQELAIALYTQDFLSFGKARELAQMDKYEFGQLLVDTLRAEATEILGSTSRLAH